MQRWLRGILATYGSQMIIWILCGLLLFLIVCAIKVWTEKVSTVWIGGGENRSGVKKQAAETNDKAREQVELYKGGKKETRTILWSGWTDRHVKRDGEKGNMKERFIAQVRERNE